MSTPQEQPVSRPAQPKSPMPPLNSHLRPRRRQRLNYVKAGLTCLLGIYGLICALNPKTFRILDWVDLVFHEAGHAIFGFFGEFVGVLGGSFMQLLVPTMVTGYFLLYNQRWSGMVTLFWVGQSLVNVSVYVKDARAEALPLLGGDDTLHDWNWLLGKLHLLRWDQIVGNSIYLLGVVVIVASIVGGLYLSREDQSAAE